MKLPTPIDPNRPDEHGPGPGSGHAGGAAQAGAFAATVGRQSVAKASAIRTLERLARERRRQPMPPMPDGWYPHEPGDPFYELDWVFLHEHPAILRRHWEMAWREGRV